MDFILTDVQKAITGLTLTFIVLPGIALFIISKIVSIIPEKILEKVL